MVVDGAVLCGAVGGGQLGYPCLPGGSCADSNAVCALGVCLCHDNFFEKNTRCCQYYLRYYLSRKRCKIETSLYLIGRFLTLQPAYVERRRLQSKYWSLANFYQRSTLTKLMRTSSLQKKTVAFPSTQRTMRTAGYDGRTLLITHTVVCRQSRTRGYINTWTYFHHFEARILPRECLGKIWIPQRDQRYLCN